MPARNRNFSLFAVASLITILSAPVMAADDVAGNAPSAQALTQAPAPAASNHARPAEARAVPVTLRPDGRYKYLSRYHNFILRVRCAHIGCPGVHTLGVAY